MSESRRPAVVMVVVALLALIAGGCGSASSKSPSSSRTRSVSKPASSRPAVSAAPASVAVVAGTPITQSAFNHWMSVAAKSQASQTPGTPAIVPDPPAYKGYQAFLAKTGQTDQDVRLRFRINLILTRLSAREKGSATARETAVTKREKKAYASQTHCTALVLMADCGNYRAG